MSTTIKIRHLSAAILHFKEAKTSFKKAIDGINIYNQDSAIKKNEEAIKQWLAARYRKIAVLSIKALAKDDNDKSLLKTYSSQLTNLLREESLGSDLRQQIFNRRADILNKL